MKEIKMYKIKRNGGFLEFETKIVSLLKHARTYKIPSKYPQMLHILANLQP